MERQGLAELDAATAQEIFEEHVLGIDTDHLLVLDERDRHRIFNLGYFTWVEQQGVALEDFEARREQTFWKELRRHLAAWDERIEAFHRAGGAAGRG